MFSWPCKSIDSFQVFVTNQLTLFLSSGSAILSDITTPENRSKALAHVGIAFAICFCIGPPIGAYFASKPLPSSLSNSGVDLNIYAVPAIITVILLVAETLFLAVALPETNYRGVPTNKVGNGSASSSPSTKARKLAPAQERIRLLKTLRIVHFFFLGIFSGMEFTLTFLTFDRAFDFHFCHSQIL